MNTGSGIAVLITYYNEGDLLRECLESISRQSVLPDEVIVYDDASQAPARDYIPAGLEVRVLRGKTNRGPSVGRNILLEASKSPFVHFHDADDLFSRQWCARVSAAFSESPVDAVFTEIVSYGPEGLVTDRVLGLHKVLQGMDLVRFCIRGVMLTQAGSYKRQSVLAIGGYRTDLWQSEDYDFHIRLAASGIQYTVIAEPLVIQRLRTGARHYRWLEVWDSYLQSLGRLSGELPEQYRPDVADAAVRAGSALFQLGARKEANRAFSLAERIGPPAFSQHRRVYQMLTRALGFEATEWLAYIYRSIIPRIIRAQLAPKR